MLIASTMHGINILQITLIGKGVENDREAKNHNLDLKSHPLIDIMCNMLSHDSGSVVYYRYLLYGILYIDAKP